MIKQAILEEIESIPGLSACADELIGSLVRVQTNKGDIRSRCGYNTEATDLRGLIANPSQFPLGAHYWYGIISIVSMCNMCPSKEICNGTNTIVIKRHSRIKCVLLH